MPSRSGALFSGHLKIRASAPPRDPSHRIHCELLLQLFGLPMVFALAATLFGFVQADQRMEVEEGLMESLVESERYPAFHRGFVTQ